MSGIKKPSRSKNANGKAKYCGNCGTAVAGKFCTECGTAINANATAETPKASPAYESAPFYGGKIWIGKKSGRIWIDGEIDMDSLRKKFKFGPDEYKSKKRK